MPSPNETITDPASCTLAAIRLLAIGLIGIALVTGQALAQTAPEPTTTFELTASALEINEGDIVEFDLIDKQYIDPLTNQVMEFEADLSPVTWEFDDDSAEPAEAYGLYNIKHRFLKNQQQPFNVKVTHQGSSKNVAIKVRNVPPKVHTASVTKFPRANKPVLFHALAQDPGLSDNVTFSWDFGDGSTATGPIAYHTYSREDTFWVTLIISDGETSESVSTGPAAPIGGTFSVTTAGEDFRDLGVNTFTVSGDFSQEDVEIEGTIIAGSTHDPSNIRAGDACQIRLEMRSRTHDMGVTLTALLDTGFAPGDYNIGNTTEWGGTHKNDAAAQGTFFAEYVPPNDEATRNFNGTRVSGPFWSDHGRVRIVRFEDGLLELFFEAELTENIPSPYEGRKVTVRGVLSTMVSTLSMADGAESPIGSASIPLADLFNTSQQTAFDLKAYYCGGEEPAEFKVLSSDPDSNAVNAKYNDATVGVEFSQVIDPDSLVDPDTLKENLHLYFYRDDDELVHAQGGWVVSPENPRVARFVPQSHLIPGLIYCVFIQGGENGVRGFGGSLLSGSALAPASDEMVGACPATGTDEVVFSFSTAVELASAWVDVYDNSLAGEHAEIPPRSFSLSGLNPRGSVGRVYTYWQNAYEHAHSSAKVTEFPARVRLIKNGRPLGPPGISDSSGPQDVTIKLPMLFSSSELRNTEHTIEFFSKNEPGSQNYFPVIQPLSKDGQPLEPVYPGVPVQIVTFENTYTRAFSAAVTFIPIEGVCAAGLSPDQCAWAGGAWHDAWLPQMYAAQDRFRIIGRSWYPDNFGLTETDTQVIETTQISLEDLAQEVVNRVLPILGDLGRSDALVAVVPPGLLENPEDQPIVLITHEFPTPDVIFVQVDRINAVALHHQLLIALLGNDACRFKPNEVCSHTPVQGMKFNWDASGGFIKHHIEGNGESEQLIPLLKSVPYDQYNETDFHISTYNYSKLLKELRRRYEFDHGDSPNS